ncbi:MAG: adenylate/guanylate cyclase domain-containing protein [Anaerolineae bacterium]|nr:adenylate/guanylate cyclase domain-containing protein [Anaerolineae bacterium]
MNREHHYQWQWLLKADLNDLWPLVADTNHFDQDAGMTPVSVVGDPPFANGRRRLQLELLGQRLLFVQEPFEWVAPYQFGVTRHFARGPVADYRVQLMLTLQAEGGTLLTYQLWARPRSLIGSLLIGLVARLARPRFERTFHRYDQLAQQGQSFVARPELPAAQLPVKATFAPGGRERLAEAQQRLREQTGWPDLVDRLARLITDGDDVTLGQIRPYTLADAWGVPRRQVLELALLATRLGVLDFRWEMLCPMCRAAGAVTNHLADTTQAVHCDTCQIDYNVDFDRSVELTFCPNPAIRLVQEGIKFCYAGPAAAPHILLQQLLAPGEERRVRLRLDPGYYHLYLYEQDKAQDWLVTPDGNTELRVDTGADTWPSEPIKVGSELELRLVNPLPEEHLITLERVSWSEHATTAAEVIVLQRFRDLFAQEALRPGEQIAVGSQTILFTDLRGSTQLYRTIGDAPAFGLVMDHFEILQQAIVNEGGSVVKTIGDAVMGAFRQPAAALRAVWQAQQQLEQGPRPLQLKAGIHSGPCIAVTLNERLDFFGSTVNLAARLQTYASGRDIILSEAVRHDPEVKAWLNSSNLEPQLTSFETPLKGFAEDCFLLWRLNQP